VNPSTHRNLLGPEIRRLRLDQGHTQEQLAELLAGHGWKSANRETVAKIENRSRCIAEYELIALGRALKVPLNKLANRQTAASLKAVFQFC
jgi:transcriptional regulator with XRE-family HTH domain